MDIDWIYLPICYAVAAGILYTFVYWIEVVLGLPTGENETDTIDQSHTNLKHLVERIIEEVFKIPELFDHSGVPKEPQRISLPQFDPKKYEELLATAVLNKLVESYSYERRFENSSGIHSGSDIDGNVQRILQKAQLETLSTSSSNEPRSDSSNSVSLNDQPMSLTATDFIGNLSRENSVISPIDSPPHTPRSVGSDEEAYLSDYIQKHKVPLPGIDAHDSDSFDEDYQSVNSNDTEGNWQENWLFKKRKLKNEMKSDIGMLVPSPMEDVKALIGDKTTDEVSDLSEAGSDIEDEENGRRSADLPHALVESKTIIGGKNEFATIPDAKTIDELLQPDSLVSTQSAESVDVRSPVIMEAKNDLILINDCDSKPIILHAKEKQHNGSKSLDDSLINERACVQNGSSQSGIIQSAKTTSKDISKGSLFDAEGVEPPVPTPRKKSKSLESAKGTVAVEGSIAEREHLKWMNAQVDIPNNPYSAEALQRRLSQTKSPSKVIDINLALAAKPIELDEDVTTKADNGKPLQIVLGAGEPDQLRYGRDYYINDSKSASGTRKKTSSIQRYSSTDEDNVSDLDQYKKNEPNSDPNQNKAIDYCSIFNNYESNPVKRSTSLNSLKRYKNSRSSDDERSVKSMTFGSKYRPEKTNSGFELPPEVINQLERHSLHGNLRRDSFRSRNGTKNFVLNPIFDERFEAEGEDEVFSKNIKTVDTDQDEDHENGLRLRPPIAGDYIETVFTDLKNLDNSKSSGPNTVRRSKSFQSNQISSHW